MKTAIIGIGMMISGTIGMSTQRIVDTIFVANGWTSSHSGFNLLFGVSLIAVVGGVFFCVSALKDKDSK